MIFLLLSLLLFTTLVFKQPEEFCLVIPKDFKNHMRPERSIQNFCHWENLIFTSRKRKMMSKYA